MPRGAQFIVSICDTKAGELTICGVCPRRENRLELHSLESRGAEPRGTRLAQWGR